MTRISATVSVVGMAVLSAALWAGPSITIYNSDLGVVRETRSVDLKAGRQRLSLGGLPEKLDPTSVHLEGEGLTLLEQDFDFDLVSADRLLQKYVDQDLKAVGKGGQVYQGRLLSYQGNDLVLKQTSGGVLLLSRSELASIEFPELPGGLVSQPTLVWTLESAEAGQRDLALSYLSGGLSWHAEYVAVLDPAEQNLGINGWVSVDNQSGASFEGAQLKLMAGDIHRAEAPPRALMYRAALAEAAPVADAAFAERAFADYHLYALAWPVTLKQAQVKQVQLFSAAAVPVVKSYLYDGEDQGKAVKVTVELKNEQASGLGLPLPAGKWRVFKADGAGRELVGEDLCGHTAKDETLRLDLGNAFDVVGERTILEESGPDPSNRERLRKVKVELRNHRENAVAVTVREHADGRWEISDSDQDWTRENADSFTAKLDLKAGESKAWTYTVKMRN
jgi:hypothetical protein